MENITRQLVDFIQASQFEQLPDEVVHEAKRLLLDSFGCALAGASTDKGRLGIELAGKLGSKPESSIIGVRGKFPMASAAFANGELINALDMDAVLVPGAGHVPPLVIPALLAIAESNRASGKDLILATVLGHEISTRLGLSLRGIMRHAKNHGQDSAKLSDVYGYSFCILGGAAAAGKIAKLKNNEMANALGLAGFMCPLPGMMKWTCSPPAGMTKYTISGWVGMGEINAVLLTRMGYTGDACILDGERGFWKFYGSDRWRPENLFEGLGQEWRMLGTNYKPYPCCRVIHSALDLFIKVIDENGLNPGDIEKVNVLLGLLAEEPLWHGLQIRNHIDAQFSVPYVISVAAHRVKPGAEWQASRTMTRRDILDFMNRVDVSTHPRFISAMLKDPINMLSAIEVTARGKTFKEEKTWAKGDAHPQQARMTDEEIISKFRENAHGILSQNKLNRAIELTFGLDTLADVTELCGCLTP